MTYGQDLWVDHGALRITWYIYHEVIFCTFVYLMKKITTNKNTHFFHEIQTEYSNTEPEENQIQMNIWPDPEVSSMFCVYIYLMQIFLESCFHHYLFVLFPGNEPPNPSLKYPVEWLSLQVNCARIDHMYRSIGSVLAGIFWLSSGTWRHVHSDEMNFVQPQINLKAIRNWHTCFQVSCDYFLRKYLMNIWIKK